MIGAIIGDIVGSRFEFHNRKSKNFELFDPSCCFTDDSVMTLALAQAILNCSGDYTNLREEAVSCMRRIGRNHPHSGYGSHFYGWLFSADPHPYNSCGNGAAMRISGVGFAAGSMEECKEMSLKVTDVTHNHPDGILGAEATASAILMARRGASIPEIRKVFTEQYYPIDFTLDELRPHYRWGALCSNTVPQALEAFFESVSFEDAIRNAVSLGGDSDTIAAITGGVAEAYYGVPEDFRKKAVSYLKPDLLDILERFETAFPWEKPKRDPEPAPDSMA